MIYFQKQTKSFKIIIGTDGHTSHHTNIHSVTIVIYDIGLHETLVLHVHIAGISIQQNRRKSYWLAGGSLSVFVVVLVT